MSDGDDEPSADEAANGQSDEHERPAEEAETDETVEGGATDDSAERESDENGTATDGEEPDEETGGGETNDEAAEETDDDASSDETTEDGDAERSVEDEDTEEDADDEGADDESTDEEDTDGEDSADEESDTTEEGGDQPVAVESLDERLDGVESDIEDAETEADLDAVERDLDEIEADIEAAELPEADEDDGDGDDGDAEGEDEDAETETEVTREELESRVTELREAIDDKRGPYAEDVVTEIEAAKTTVDETRWTEQGEGEVVAAVETFLDEAGEVLEAEFASESDHRDHLSAALSAVIETIEARDLDPDEDDETIAALLDAAEELTTNLEEAQAWDDLTVREKLAAEGFYDVLTPENKKDFPPEWNAVKIYEKQNDPEPILMGLDMFGSAFMEEHCIESLRRMGSPEAFDAMYQRAQKRNKPPIEVLGKIGDDRALETLHDYIEGESDPALQKVTIKAIGEIGSEESTQAVADRLVAENETVRSNAARSLGLIGDTRAISPLSDVLAEDDSNSVRASAAWALNQIGTESALDAAREYSEDRSFLVQSEAEKANEAMGDGADGDATEKAV